MADILMAGVLHLVDRFDGLVDYPARRDYVARATARPARRHMPTRWRISRRQMQLAMRHRTRSDGIYSEARFSHLAGVARCVSCRTTAQATRSRYCHLRLPRARLFPCRIEGVKVAPTSKPSGEMKRLTI